MGDLRIREATRADWEGPVVEVWDDDALVAQVWRDDEEVLVEVLSDADGDPFLLDVPSLIGVLDTAARILGVEETGDEGDPLDRLAEEFDHLAAHRGAEDEGFYPVQVAVPFIRRCEQLGLAVISVEGFTMVAGEPAATPGYALRVADPLDDEPWATFRAGANLQVEAVVERWPRKPGFVVAFELRDPSGEDYVL
jgi:hypothetical protein